MRKGDNDSKWVILFKKTVEGLMEKAKKQKKLKNGRDDPFWYDYDGNRLSTLKITGRGNCVAYSELAVELAKKCGLRALSIHVADRFRKDKDTHQVTIIYDDNGIIWYQSCITVRRLYKPRNKEKFFRTKKLLCKMAAKDCRWKYGAIVLKN